MPTLSEKLLQLKEAKPALYKQYMEQLSSSANNGNEDAERVLNEVIEGAARNREGYGGLNTALYGGLLATVAPFIAPPIPYIMSHPITQTVGTFSGLYNLATDQGVAKTYNHIKDGNALPAVKSAIGDLLDVSPLIGAAKAAKTSYNLFRSGEAVSNIAKSFFANTDIGRWLSATNRAKHAYATIEPYCYKDPLERGSRFVWSWLSDKPIDVDAVRPTFKYNWISNNDPLARDDAWRIYNHLPQRFNTYIKNSDGTYRYNWKSLVERNPHLRPEGLNYENYDYITSTHGRFWNKSHDIELSDGQFVQHLEDMWDLHPFERLEIFPNKGIFRRINKAIQNFEAGRIGGGRPFKLDMDIPYYGAWPYKIGYASDTWRDAIEPRLRNSIYNDILDQ